MSEFKSFFSIIFDPFFIENLCSYWRAKIGHIIYSFISGNSPIERINITGNISSLLALKQMACMTVDGNHENA